MIYVVCIGARARLFPPLSAYLSLSLFLSFSIIGFFFIILYITRRCVICTHEIATTIRPPARSRPSARHPARQTSSLLIRLQCISSQTTSLASSSLKTPPAPLNAFHSHLSLSCISFNGGVTLSCVFIRNCAIPDQFSGISITLAFLHIST